MLSQSKDRLIFLVYYKYCEYFYYYQRNQTTNEVEVFRWSIISGIRYFSKKQCSKVPTNTGKIEYCWFITIFVHSYTWWRDGEWRYKYYTFTANCMGVSYLISKLSSFLDISIFAWWQYQFQVGSKMHQSDSYFRMWFNLKHSWKTVVEFFILL